MPPAPKGLNALLAQAQSADPLDRIGYRDQIAAYGPRAILAIAPWLEDARLGAFAVRVVTVVADAGHVEDAVAALIAARPNITNPDVMGDVDALLARIAPKPAPRARRPSAAATAAAAAAAAAAADAASAAEASSAEASPTA